MSDEEKLCRRALAGSQVSSLAHPHAPSRCVRCSFLSSLQAQIMDGKRERGEADTTSAADIAAVVLRGLEPALSLRYRTLCKHAS